MRIIKIHICVWIAYFIVVYISDLILDHDTRLLTEVTIFITHNIYLFYSLLFVIRNFSFKTTQSAVFSLTRMVSVLALFFLMKYLMIYFLFPRIYGPFEMLPKITWITVGFLWIINYSLFASAYYYLRSSTQKQQEVNRLLKDGLVKENEKLELENTLLKAQINPHFLYNTLNFLYAKSLPLSDQLSNGIMKLSEIMRHSLQSHDKNGLVLLSEEIEHIRNLIEMAQLRFNNRLCIEFLVRGDFEHLKIIPFALITLVENVLKHGIVNEEAKPANIIVEITSQNQFHFTTRNYKRYGPKEYSTSIGLANTKRRLSNNYGEECIFEITDSPDAFRTDLYISMNKLISV